MNLRPNIQKVPNGIVVGHTTEHAMAAQERDPD